MQKMTVTEEIILMAITSLIAGGIVYAVLPFSSFLFYFGCSYIFFLIQGVLYLLECWKEGKSDPK